MEKCRKVKKKLRNGRDAVFVVKNGMAKYFGLEKYNKYDLYISKKRKRKFCIFSSSVFYPRLSNIVKFYAFIMDDFRFYDTLISVLKNSIFKLENVKKGLNLQDFVNNKISLRDVAQNVVKPEYNISQYKVLKELAKNYHFEDQNSHAQLRDGIKTLLSDLEVSYNNGIVTAKKKILILSQLLSYNFKNYFKEKIWRKLRSLK